MDTPEKKEAKLYLSIMKKRYRFQFTDNEGHFIRCAHCTLALASADWGKLLIEETIDSINDRKHPEWDPEWIRYSYSLPYQCVSCKGTTYSVGDAEHYFYSNHDEETGEADYEEGNLYKPKYFTPTLYIFELPHYCPSAIKKGLVKSFQLAYCDVSASANRLRATLEILIRLNFTEAEIGVRNLHDQILLLTKKFTEIGDLSLAIKWIGNEGSHGEGEVQECALAFAYEAFAKILNIIYGNKEATLEEAASLFVKVKGKL
ncbi:Uncharacterised protein [Serratia quinivorans]|uniref:DUF4145 domain-containing protein n=1 Tax=Serratia quinivorans TaxID=137545 RepID=UPI00217BF0DE|nr:DUF4145 domain-containing protein [Serratia quinivorans]CAI1616569.1 Uncharacterised protein [Serratia quinivorans]CAI2395278.1 Uncharacterised protein [Serratia quinivorans]